jgi:hypothetical protein
MLDQTPVANRRLVLKIRPTGIPGPEHFAEETVTLRTPDSGEVLLETLLLSIDPSMRSSISATPAAGARIEIGDVMRGSGIARVLESRAEGFLPGEIVQGTMRAAIQGRGGGSRRRPGRAACVSNSTSSTDSSARRSGSACCSVARTTASWLCASPSDMNQPARRAHEARRGLKAAFRHYGARAQTRRIVCPLEIDSCWF